MEKNFDEWNIIKKKTENIRNRIMIREGEVVWCRFGLNIGCETLGKGKYYRRPVLIMRKFSKNSFYSYMKTFTTTDRQGYLVQIDLDGKLSKKNLNITIDNLIDIKNDNLVYISENILSIKGININLPFGRYSKPKIFNESSRMLIGISDFSENNIYLYEDNGELIKGFPLKGNSIIDIRDSDKDGKIEVITRLDNYSIVSYELN